MGDGLLVVVVVESVVRALVAEPGGGPLEGSGRGLGAIPQGAWCQILRKRGEGHRKTQRGIDDTHGEDMLVLLASGLREKMDLLDLLEEVEPVESDLAWKKGLL